MDAFAGTALLCGACCFPLLLLVGAGIWKNAALQHVRPFNWLLTLHAVLHIYDRC